MKKFSKLIVAAMIVAPLSAAAGEEFQDCEACPVMVEVGPGGFPRAMNFDAEVTDVMIEYAYAIGKFEVTVGEYREFVEESGLQSGGCTLFRTTGDKDYEDGGWDDPGFRQRDSRPVVCVSWEDANAYAGWLSQKTGASYRLPSEAEWEFAARAGAGHISNWFFTGNLRAGQANCSTCYGSDVMGREDDLTTAKVGGSGLNSFGLADMLGNAAEWTLDCANKSNAGAPVDGGAWLEGECEKRVTKGGAFHNEWVEIARYRISRDRSRGRNDVGFRLVREIP